jgi:putative phage-type endonuclease
MITAEQRQLRRRYIGSSDAAAILGLDPYRSASDVWMEKTGRLDDADRGNDRGNDATAAGNVLERAVLDWAERSLDRPLNRDVMKVAGDLCANLDGEWPGALASAPFVVEAKTTGIVGLPDPGYGEPGTDQVPERVIIQTHHQMFVTGYALAWVPVLIGGRGFCMYQVERDEALAAAIAERASAFVDRHVKTDTPPDDFRPSVEILRRARRQPGKVVTLDDEIVSRFVVARAARIQAEEAESYALADLIAALGDAEAGDYTAGRVTYFQATRKAYTVKESTYRTLRLVKAGKGTA